MSLQLGRVDHDSLLLPMFGGQTSHHPGENAFLAPTFPAALKRLMWTIGDRSVAPTQAIAIDENNPAQHTPVIDAGFAVGVRKEGLKTRHLRLRQPEKIRHVQRSFLEL